MNPPPNASDLSVDEKPSIQAIQRPSGYIKTDSGAIVWAMEIANVQVFAQTTEPKKREDFPRFLDAVLADLPSEKEIHVILNNYSTHKRSVD